MPAKSRLFQRLSDGSRGLARRLARDDRGAIAVQFAFLIIPIAILVFGLVDLGRISLMRREMQDALDAATLIAARSTASTNATLEAVGDPAFLAEVEGRQLGLTASSSTFTLGTNNRIIGNASGTLQPIIANLWRSGGVTVVATSEVVRSSKHLEVALVLDITGSMKGTRLADLKVAARDLVDVLVRDAQTPYYSKMALVPYSAGVNLGTYADAARGPVPVKTITGAGWSAGTAKSISAITKASPAQVTANSHGLATNDYVYITGVGGMTMLNGKIYRVTKVDANRVTLNGADTRSSSNASGGTIQKCLLSTCKVVVTTSTDHGFTTGDKISFAGMSGLTSLNGTTKTITVVSNTTFDPDLTGPGSATYTSGGTATCFESTVPGCERIRFTNVDGYETFNSRSDCATERTGDEAYTDAAPSTAYVGSHYPTFNDSLSSTNCPVATITPLSTDKTALKAQISALADGGATAGHIGLAWGWYMIAPNFGYLWPNASQRPAAYRTRDLMKVVIMMTDGAFNMPYCKGVVAKDLGSGTSIGNDEKINCNATNGSSFAQAAELCQSIKASDNAITVYTVGFTVGNDQAARDFLTTCASSADKAYFPATGSELKTSFNTIAQEISNLRLSR